MTSDKSNGRPLQNVTNLAGMADVHQEILGAAERFAAEQVRPGALKHEADASYPSDLIAAAKKLGLFGLVIPASYGGLELPLPVFAQVMEIIARAWTSFASHITSHATVAYTILRHGTEKQRSSFLRLMATGELHAAILLTEDHAGSDLQAIRTRAELVQGTYVINGKKTYISNGRNASLLLVLAQTDPTVSPPKRGLSLFLVGPDHQDGVTRANAFEKMAFDCVDTCEVVFEDVKVPDECVLGEVKGRGLNQLLDGLELGRLTIAASAVGLAAAALDEAIQFARHRTAFGVAIKQHQAVRLRIAEMATAIEAARALTARAAAQLELGETGSWTAMAKLVASETALTVTTDALRIHGGSGYIRGVMVERLFREAPLYIVGEGTNDILKLGISRGLLGD